MRTPVQNHVARIGNSVETITGRIEASATGHIMDTIANLYADDILAFIREYSTNARDASIEAGNADDPIYVSLPTEDDPRFVVQDFGTGLSIDELRDIYLSYGSSTKRDSDDYNGTLGFGSKSGLAYAPLGFHVTAVKDGQKVLAVVQRDEVGVAVMEVLYRDSAKAGERNGVTVAIPVEHHDIRRVQDTAHRFYRAWRPGTVVQRWVDADGNEREVPFASYWDGDGDVSWLDDEQTVGLINPESSGSRVIMGNVPYEVDRRSAWGFNVIAEVGMGDVDFPPNRESLRLTDRTVSLLDSLFEYVEHEAIRVVIDRVVAIENMHDRLWEWHRIDEALPRRLRAVLRRQLVSILPRQEFTTEAITYRWTTDRRNNVSTLHKLTFQALGSQPLIVTGFPVQGSDVGQRARKHLRRFRELRQEHGRPTPSTVYLLHESVHVEAIEMLDGYDPQRIIAWDELVRLSPMPKVERVSGQRAVTLYPTRRGDVYTTETGDELAEDDRLLLWTYRPVDRVNSVAFGSYGANYYAGRHPFATVVELETNQLNRFLREHPRAKSAAEFDLAERRRATARLTDVDRFIMRGTDRWRWLIGKELLDPEAKRWVDLIEQHPESTKAAKRAEQLRLQVEDTSGSAEAWQAFVARYPLVSDALRHYNSRVAPRNADDIVLYMNARYTEDVLNAGVFPELADSTT